MPSEPQTESGRSLGDWLTWASEKGFAGVPRASVVAKAEQEAASKAVAEVLDRLEHRVRANYGTLPTGDRVCALIASERER